MCVRAGRPLILRLDGLVRTTQCMRPRAAHIARAIEMTLAGEQRMQTVILFTS